MNAANGRRGRGFSLIELMVSMALGIVVVLAITGVMVRGEGSKRSMTTLNDLNQTGAYLSYLLDRNLRSAGSGYVQRWADAVGCTLNVSIGGSVALPRGSALPVPFAGVSAAPRLAPVVVLKNQSAAGSDVLMVMTGSAGFSESPLRVLPSSVTSSGLRLPNTLNTRGDDLVLLADSSVGCLLQQVQSGFTGSDDQALPLAGSYAAASSGSVSLTSFGTSGSSYAISLGNAVDNRPLFQLIGVGANATLFSYDLLRLDGTDAPLPIGDSVVELHAVYGLDTDGDGKLDSWADPGSAPFTAAALQDGSSAAQTNLRQIVAIRIALVLRSPLVEKTQVTLPALSLFSDLGALKQTVTLSGDDLNRRFRVVEFTVPLRNLLL